MNRLAVRTALAFASLMLAACTQPPNPADPGKASPSTTQPAASSPVADVSAPVLFVGVLPCADCEGIRHELDLHTPQAYLLRTTYLGKSAANVFDDIGTWSVSPDGRTLTLTGGRESPTMFAIDGDSLRLLDRSGQEIASELNYTLARQAAYTPIAPGARGVTHDLVGTRWVPVLLRGEAVVTSDGQREQYIALSSPELRVVGNAGCNRLSGGYQLAADALSFSQVVTTRMACPEMNKETALLEALESTARWRILGAHLELFDGSGNLLARFESRNL